MGLQQKKFRNLVEAHLTTARCEGIDLALVSEKSIGTPGCRQILWDAGDGIPRGKDLRRVHEEFL